MEFIFALEETTDRHRRLHMHGELGISVDEAELARLCLRKAAGEWKTVRQHQAHTEPEPDDLWIGYLTKEVWRTTPFMRALYADCHKAVLFTGNPLFVTLGVKQRAKANYMAIRTIVQ